MKSLVIALALAVAFVAALAVPTEADARRFGGGGFSGMQRSMPRTTPSATPAKPATPNAQPGQAGAAGAAAAAPRRSWMGPIAGLAAGLGLAALMSHLGLGAELANFIMLALLGVVAFVAIRFLMRRFAPGATGNAGGMQYVGANANARADGTSSLPFSAQQPAPAAATQGFSNGFDAHAATLHDRGEPATSLPPGFDTTGFERIAKMIFIRMQTANDAGDLNDLRNFTTPEMFAAARLEIQERGAKVQRTDVVRVDAEVLDVTSDAERQIVSVRFHGLIREELDGVAEPFDEIWHLVKPADGSREWAIAGVQQSTAALLAEAA